MKKQGAHRLAVYLIITLLCAACSLAAQQTDSYKAGSFGNTRFAKPETNFGNGYFKTDSALVKLFPGRYYSIAAYNDTFKFVAWKCPSCKTMRFTDWEDSETDFPDSAGNDTRVLGTIPYTDETGREFVMLATSTTRLEELILTGRFRCGVLGMATFEKNNGRWSLQYFNPAVLCGGAFATAPMPQLLKTGNRVYGFTASSVNGPAGGPFYGDVRVILPYHGSLKQMLTEGFASCVYDGKNEWKTTVSAQPDSSSDMPELTLTTTGHYSTAVFAQEDTGWFPKPVRDAAKKTPDFNFELKTTYRYKNGKYTSTSQYFTAR